jgi:hypothetical protein
MRPFLYITLLILINLILFQSCKKFDWSNPYDPDSPKSLFTPSGPSAAMQGNNVRLTWNQDNDRISGFVLYRSSEQSGITSLTQVQKTTKEYIDASVTPGCRQSQADGRYTQEIQQTTDLHRVYGQANRQHVSEHHAIAEAGKHWRHQLGIC